MFNYLEDIIKKTNGNVLTICLDDKLMESFKNNNKINLYAINSNENSGFFSKNSKRKTNKGKIINIKKLRKHINKKSVDYMFCNMNEIFKYYKYFIKDSVHLNNKKLYIYLDKEQNKDLIVNNYKRYNVQIELKEFKTGYIIIVDNTNSKTNFIKDIIYFIKDTFYNLADIVGNLLVN